MIRFASIAVPLCWLASCAWANLVSNGNFAGGTFDQSFGSCPGTAPSCVTDILPDSWSLAPANVSNLNVVSAISGFPDPLGDSTQYMAFESLASNGQDCLFQSIPTVADQTYTISFWLAVSAAGSYIYMSFEWDVGGSNDQTLYPSGFTNAFGQAVSTTGPVAFEEFTYNLVASSSQTGFYFHGDGAGSTAAVLLADVSVNEDAAPEPPSFWFIGSGLAIVACWVGQRSGSLLLAERAAQRISISCKAAQ